MFGLFSCGRGDRIYDPIFARMIGRESEMPRVEKLNALVGGYINLEYRLPHGKTVKFLDDNATYLGNQLECEFGGDRCFGLVANMKFLLVCTYEENGANPELVIYKKR